MLVLMQSRIGLEIDETGTFRSAKGQFLVAVAWENEERTVRAKIGRCPVQSFARTSHRRLTPDELGSYEGEYYSEELQRTIRLVARGNSLVVEQHKPFIDLPPLEPVGTDLFGSQKGIVLHFQRDKNGQITGMCGSTSRARGVLFRRVVED